MNDPLKGMRRKIANGEVKVLRWPADQPCPVQNGDRFKVQGIEIEIHSVKRHIAPGKPVEWHATFIRHEKDRVYLLRQAPPVHATHETLEDISVSKAERARRDGNYTSSRVSAVPDEPESVGPDWKDDMAEKRRLRHQQERREVERKRAENLLHRKLGEVLKAADDDQHVHILAQVAKLVDPPDQAA